MKQLSKLTILLFLIATVIISASCSSSRKSTCGCEGFVGYGNRR